MEVQIRRHRKVQIHDQENVYAGKEKGSRAALHPKKQGLGVRGALGDINTNVQIQRDTNVGQVACAAAEFEKKAIIKSLKSNYSHVQSKVDTGLAVKNVVQPTTKPVLRREESTAGHASRAIARSRVSLRGIQPAEIKESINIYIQTKKTEKNMTKMPAIKENKTLKPILKEPTESLRKLKLAEDKRVSQFDFSKLQARTDSLQDSFQLPEDVEDIDAKDYNNPVLMSIYIKDIYRYLTGLEVKYSIEYDHMKKQAFVTGKMRATLLDWLMEVQGQFNMMLEVFHLTVGIIDRYLQAVPNVPRCRLQLVGITALYIAAKYEEVYAPDVNDYVFVTDRTYSKADILQCELEVLSKLGFSLARPIPLSFLRRFVKVAGGTSTHHHLAKYFVDLSLLEYEMSHYRPSELAAAAVCLSFYLLSSDAMEDKWTPTMVYYSGYKLDHLRPIIKQFAIIVLRASESKFQSARKRYSQPSLAKVACLPQLSSDTIIELASS